MSEEEESKEAWALRTNRKRTMTKDGRLIIQENNADVKRGLYYAARFMGMKAEEAKKIMWSSHWQFREKMLRHIMQDEECQKIMETLKED